MAEVFPLVEGTTPQRLSIHCSSRGGFRHSGDTGGTRPEDTAIPNSPARWPTQLKRYRTILRRGITSARRADVAFTLDRIVTPRWRWTRSWWKRTASANCESRRLARLVNPTSPASGPRKNSNSHAGMLAVVVVVAAVVVVASVVVVVVVVVVVGGGAV